MFTKIINLIFAYKTECNAGKNPLLSKTMWVNIVALFVWVSSKYLNVELSAEDSLAILAVINMILRMITKKPVGFYELS